MRLLTLYEYRASEPVQLTIQERDSLKDLVPSLKIAPIRGSSDEYTLTASSDIGAVRLPNLAVEIRPKIPMDRLLFLISYAIDPKQWRQLGFDFAHADSLVEAIIPGFAAQLNRTLQGGLLQGYRREDDALPMVRGRIRFEEQIRGRNGIFPPVEVTFDEFTEDILENQLLKAALSRLRSLNIRSHKSIWSLRHYEYLLQNVSTVHFHPRQLPDLYFTRLNSHYEPAIALAKLILAATSIELGHGVTESTAFLVDMNAAFETFVAVALRESLGLSSKQFQRNAENNLVALDSDRRIRLKPDLYWVENGSCVFVGDVKYKNLEQSTFKHGDVYQLLAYTIATNLPSGLLIYAAGEAEAICHRIPQLDKMLEVMTLDIEGTPDDILNSIGTIAKRILSQRAANAMISATPNAAPLP